MSFIYTDNKQLVIETKKMIIESEYTQTEICKKMSIKTQQLQNIFKKENLSFKDVEKICNAANYDLIIEFKKRNKMQ